MNVTFLLNGSQVVLRDIDPTTTLLDWLREDRGLTGTKEGCNEGDCGACSVIVTDADGPHALNACILFLPQLDGKAVRTVEGIAAPDGTLHPVQEAMIHHHGSQCGFCTPGFITTMACAHLNGATDHATQLAGNLCRCTGYAPILKAAEAAATAPMPDHIDDRPNLLLFQNPSVESSQVAQKEPPKQLDAFADWYAAHPEATLIAGATDVGLWVTKEFADLGEVAFLNQVEGLRGIRDAGDAWHIGAMTTLSDLLPFAAQHHPSLAELIRRYGSTQVRNAATIGGNIANGSPIGDGSPAFIALGATLHLRHGTTRRSMPLEDFFLDYKVQDRAPGEFVEAISVPKQPDHLRCYKLSKRFDQDISAVCGCFWIEVEDDQVAAVRLAYGGIAGTPKRAAHAEAVLLGAAWSEPTVLAAMAAMQDDFAPMSDMRGSADYRMQTAQAMLMRAYRESAGETAHVLEVRA